MSILACGHIFHEQCYSPFRSTSCASCQVTHTQVGGGDPRDTILIRDSSVDGAGAGSSDAVSVSLRHPAVKALLSVVEGELSPKTLMADTGGGDTAGETRRARQSRAGARGGAWGAAAAAGGRRGSSGGQLRSAAPRAEERRPEERRPGERRGVPGAEPGWLRGTTKAPVAEPASAHALDDLTVAFGGGQPGDRVSSPASPGAMDARTRLLRGRPVRR